MADTIYKVKDPSGAIREIRGPEGASDDEIISQAQKLFGQTAPKPSMAAQYADVTAGIPEAALGFASGAVAAPVAGLAGIVASAIPELPEGTGANVVNKVSNALTYSPRTQTGQNIVNTVSAPFHWLANKADAAGGAVAEATDSPLAGAAVNTAIQALPLAAGPALKAMGPVKQMRPEVIAAHEAGYTMTPREMGAGTVARTAASLAGEPRLAKAVSLKNQPIYNQRIAKDLKLPEGTVLDSDVVRSVRENAGSAYENARNLGPVELDPQFRFDLARLTTEYSKAESAFPGRKSPVLDMADRLNQSGADAGAIVSEINLLRKDANKAYASRDYEFGKAAKDAAAALEDQLIRHAQKTGQSAEVVEAMRGARATIAKSYAADKALNGNNINPMVYAAELRRGKPLTGGAREVGEFSTDFPRSSMNTKNIGETGPTFHDFGAALLGSLKHGGLTLPLMAARPVIRGILSSDMGQAAMINTPAVLEAIRRGQASPLAGILEMSLEK